MIGGEVPVVEQRAHVHAHRRGVGQVPVAVGACGRHRQSDRGGVGAERVGVDAEALDGGEDLQQHEPLRVRRHDAHVEVAVAADERRHQLRAVGGEVLEREGRPGRAQALGVPAPDLAAVHRGGAGGGDRLERRAERRHAQDVALLQRAAVREEDLRDAGVGRELGALRQRLGQSARHRHPVVRAGDRGREVAGPVEPRALVAERPPAGDGARHGDRQWAALRHRAERGADLVGVDGGRRGAARVDGDDVGLLGARDECEQVAADATRLRVHDGERGGGGERRVHRVAAGLEGVGPCLRGGDVRRRDGPAAARGGEIHGSSVPGGGRGPLRPGSRGTTRPSAPARPAGGSGSSRRNGGTAGPPGRRPRGRPARSRDASPPRFERSMRAAVTSSVRRTSGSTSPTGRNGSTREAHSTSLR